MRTVQALCAVVFAIGIVLLVTGGLCFRAAADQQDGAEISWRRQQEAQAAFHRASGEVSRKLQAGEIDNAGWSREVEAFSNQFKTDSEAAGKAWVDQSESASRLRFQSTNLLATGLFVVFVGMISFARSVKAAASCVAINHRDMA